MKKVILHTLLLVISGAKIFAGNNPVVASATITGIEHKGFVASNDIFGTRVFVENHGQFDSKSVNGQKILYAFDHGQEKIYFTPKGLIYEMVQTYPLTHRQREQMEEGKNIQMKPDESHFFQMNWVGNITGHAEIIPSIKQSHYITYGEEKYNSYTFKKLTYKNVYNGIDIEYVIPEEKTHGIKYNVILHAGASPGEIKILYSGEVGKIKKKRNGDVLINSTLSDLVEHLPESYYAGGAAIESEFRLTGDTIGFNFPRGFQNDKDIVIDPWVATTTTFTNNNLAYDVDYDFGANVFIFGSYGYAKVAMYNASGVLQWTFSGQIMTPSWTSQIGGMSGSVGAFAVDKISGKTYVGQGANWPSVVRLNNAGVYDNFITPTNNLFQELWEMNFGCLSNDVMIVGGGHTSNLSAATINTATPVLVLSSFNPANTAFVHDISAFCQDDVGNTFCYYACSNAALNQKITRVNSTYNGSVWTVSSGYNSLQEINNKNNYGAGTIASAGYNGLNANGSYLYFFDGMNLAAYNKATGSLVSSITTTNAIKSCGGVAADDCNNIYVGGIGFVMAYHFNGTSFSTLTPIPLTVANNPRVIDIRLNRSTGQLAVSGVGFVGMYTAIHSGTCPVAPGTCLFALPGIAASTSSITCATLGSATVTPNNGLGPYTFTWVPSMQTGSVGTGLAPGQHTIVVYDAGYNIQYTTTTFFAPAVPLTATVSATSGLLCNGVNNGTAGVTNIGGGSASQNYTWTSSTNTFYTQYIGGLGAGNYSVMIQDVLTGCQVTQSFTVYQPQPLTCFLTASSPTACVGGTITLNTITGGGTPAYTYSWTNGPPTASLSVSYNTPGNYSYVMTSKDANNCAIAAVGSVSFVPLPAMSVAHFSICPLQTGTLSASGASSYTWNGTSNGSTFTDAPLVNTEYTVAGTALGCTAATTASIIIKPVPVPVLNSNSPVCNGQALSMSAAGGISSVWQGPLGFSSPNNFASIANASPSRSGAYNVTVTAANSCTASSSINLTVNPTPTISALGSTVCNTQTVSLSTNAGAAVAFTWLGPNGYYSSQQNPVISSPQVSVSGQYTVYIAAATNCTNFATANVTVTPMPVANVVNDGPKCAGNNVSLMGSGSTGGVTFSWSGPNGYFSGIVNSTLQNPTQFASGVYTLVITEGPCITSATTQVVVHPLPSPSAAWNSPVCENAQLSLTVTCPASNSIVSYGWTGPAGFNSTLQFPQRANSQLNFSGNYIVTVNDIHNCISTATVGVNIGQNPVVTAIGDTVCFKNPARISASGASTYTWTVLNMFAGNTPTILVGSAQNVQPLTYLVIGTAPNTCTGAATAMLSTYPLPPISASVWPAPALCLNSEFTFFGHGGVSYTWEGPSNFKAAGQEVKFNAASTAFTGMYKVYGTDARGCSNSNSVSIIVNNLPSGDLTGGPFEACVPFCGNYKFLASTQSASITFSEWKVNKQKVNGRAFAYCFDVSGSYIMEGLFTDANGCTNTGSTVVIANPKPVADFIFNPERPVENSEPVLFTDKSSGEKINKWNWQINDPNAKSQTYNGRDMTWHFDQAGAYAVALVIKDENNCSDTAIKSVLVDEDFVVYVPNAFTPNSDSKNELFAPVLRGQKFIKMQVFDRWGQLIFETADAVSGWDGTYKGVPCKQDTYNWKMQVASKSGTFKTLTGTITLYR